MAGIERESHVELCAEAVPVQSVKLLQTRLVITENDG